MCMFTINKPSQISPQIFSDYQHRWKELVMKAQAVYVIGVRPHLVDKHIWEPLTETNANLFYIGSKEQFDGWFHKRPNGKSTFIHERFDEAIPKIANLIL
jgi:hypothetical protein